MKIHPITRMWSRKTHSLPKVLHNSRTVISFTYPHTDPGATHEDLVRGLQEVVHQSGQKSDVSETIHADTSKVASHPWLYKFIPGIEKWESTHHIGNFVAIRGTDQTIFETMPIYAR
jgi:phosphatidylserine decarboxylase